MTNTSKNKTITVIVAAYKAQAYIKEALASILEQKIPQDWKLQLIVGVDGCYPTRREIINIDDPRLEVYFMKQNRGTYVTFNTMVEYARGDVLARFDADDIMLPDYLNRSVECIEEGYSFIRYKFQSMDFSSKRLHDTGLAHGQLTFTKKLWDTVGGFQPWKCAADTEFCFKAGWNKEFKSKHLTDKVYMLYRRTESQLTSAAKTAMGSPYRSTRHEQIKRMRASRSWVPAVPLIGRAIRIK